MVLAKVEKEKKDAGVFVEVKALNGPGRLNNPANVFVQSVNLQCPINLDYPVIKLNVLAVAHL
ncbi:MAG: hypothetical protein JXA79_04090 [Deltaproteobacteria bacterium]|nr:hypothetical protein [Deltaproteobacteria bacterium]